ncbi:hypothetical protein Rsub_09988 [Raphidocelis subcapitata]|uniref:Uncharacterized protein n=1 Tax=Raphidocelis subcapitata TaxID=307507 RepID=A0A2V0PIZ8_9CHLO|nr:hypothetical protein Rsub_09988 [Raphidocelis subcapitata]|eukprot:GBF97297.1 hypothetical protein Rsub_09988 [Raphidocelis subcapitata]
MRRAAVPQRHTPLLPLPPPPPRAQLAPLLLARGLRSMAAAALARAGPMSSGVACGAAPRDGAAAVEGPGGGDSGLPFALSRPWRPLRFPWVRRLSGVSPADVTVEVDSLLEGAPTGQGRADLEALLAGARADTAAVVPLALAAKKARLPRWRVPALASVSLVLCDDAYIASLNAAHRGKEGPTDVLSFEVPDEPGEVAPPIKLLGDLVVSLDTAARQAEERGYSLRDELRVLLVHGVLHLAGFDHERGGEDLGVMAAAEAQIMGALGWKGEGLIEAAGTAADSDDDDDSGGGGAAPAASSSTLGSTDSGDGDGGSTASGGSGVSRREERAASGSKASTSAAWSGDSILGRSSGFRTPRVGLVALDMDGTLLDSDSKIRPASAKVIRAALDQGTRVVLATGKARPAAVTACAAAGLAGEGLLVSRSGPGVFLQGLAVHGRDGSQLSDAALPRGVVASAFEWAAAAGVSCVAFLGDECATLALTPALVELHERYYEPLARVHDSLPALLEGPAVRKLLFMSEAARIAGEVAPHWAAVLGPEGGADVMQAVPNMLEVVPAGVNKWAGLQVLLGHLGLSPADLVAVGDGGNDEDMVRHAGVGVAMGNAVHATRAAASALVASNDEDGIVEAFERFVLL